MNTAAKEIKPTQQLLTRKLLSIKLSISKKHISNLEKKGLPVIWVGSVPRYDYESVIKWLSEYKKNQQGEGGGKNATS